MRDGFFMTDSRGVITFANGALAAMFGFDEPARMIGRGFVEFVDEESREETITKFAAFMTSDRDTDYLAEIRTRREDGTVFFIELKASAIRSFGAMTGTRGIIRDITERKRAEDAIQNANRDLEAANEELNATNEELAGTLQELVRSQEELEGKYSELKESEARFRAIFDNSLDAISVSRDGVNLYVNSAYVQLHGYADASEIIGRPVMDMIPAAYSETVGADIRRRAEGDTQPRSFESRGLRADGSEFDFEVHVSGFPLGGITHSLAIIRDISGRKRAEEAMRASLEEKETLLRELYHRTKNNMQVLISMLALQAAGEKDERILRVFRETAGRISSIALVHQKLYRSQNLSRIDLREYVEELVPLMMSSYGVTTGSIAQDYRLASMQVLIDIAIPCGLVLNELVSNTLKYAFPDGRKGTLAVSLRELPGGAIELAYADDGVGMPEGFDFSAVKTLGISMVRNIVEHQLQGTVEFPAAKGFACVMRFDPVLYAERL